MTPVTTSATTTNITTTARLDEHTWLFDVDLGAEYLAHYGTSAADRAVLWIVDGTELQVSVPVPAGPDADDHDVAAALEDAAASIRSTAP